MVAARWLYGGCAVVLKVGLHRILDFTPVTSKAIAMVLQRNCICPLIVCKGQGEVETRLTSQFEARHDPSVLILTRTSHYDSYTVSGTGYNDDAGAERPERRAGVRQPGGRAGADGAGRADLLLRELHLHGAGDVFSTTFSIPALCGNK